MADIWITDTLSFWYTTLAIFSAGVMYSLLGAFDGVANARRGETVLAEGRIAWNSGQAAVMPLVTIPIIDTLLYQAFGVYLVHDPAGWLTVPPPSAQTDAFSFVLLYLSLAAVWFLFFMKVHDSFIRWRHPEAKFNPIYCC